MPLANKQKVLKLAPKISFSFGTSFSVVNIYFWNYQSFFINLSKTFPSASTSTADAMASGMPEAVMVPMIRPHTAVMPTSCAWAYCWAKSILPI